KICLTPRVYSQLPFIFILVAVVSTLAGQFSNLSAQTKITIGYAAVSPRTTPLYIAQEQGIFTKYGIDAKVVLFRGADVGGKSRFRRNGRRLHGLNVAGGRRGAGQRS